MSAKNRHTDRFNITEHGLDQADQIEPLWQKLNALHHSRSIHFKSHFASYSFRDRIGDLKASGRVKIFSAAIDDLAVGYCICSIKNNVGEIDSLYVEKSYRGEGLGHELVNRALNWFSINRIEKHSVSLSHGNEEAIPFYERFGFRPRLVVMTKSNTP